MSPLTESLKRLIDLWMFYRSGVVKYRGSQDYNIVILHAIIVTGYVLMLETYLFGTRRHENQPRCVQRWTKEALDLYRVEEAGSDQLVDIALPELYDLCGIHRNQLIRETRGIVCRHEPVGAPRSTIN